MLTDTATFLWWDDEKGRIIGPLAQEWHDNYMRAEQGRHPRSRVKGAARSRFVKIGPGTAENVKRLKGVTTLMDAKAILNGNAPKPQEVSAPQAEATQPEEDAKKPTRESINRLRMAGLTKLAAEYGVDIREGMSASDLKVQLIKALEL